MRDATGFGGGADKWAAVVHCHLSVQRAKGGEYLQPKVPVFFFFFRPWDKLVVLYIIIIHLFSLVHLWSRTCYIISGLHWLACVCVCAEMFVFFFLSLSFVHRLCILYEPRWLHLAPPFFIVGTSAFGFFLRLNATSISVVTGVSLLSKLNFAAHFHS